MRIHILVSALVLIPLLIAAGAAAQDDDRERAPPFTPSWAAPQLEVSPRDGRPGDVVSITGGDFDDDVRAYYGNSPMRVLQVDDDRIDAEIPPGAADDRFIYVVDDTGRARTSNRFALLRRAPRQYDPRYDPRDPRYDPRYEPRDPRYDPRDPRYDPRYDRRCEPRDRGYERRDGE